MSGTGRAQKVHLIGSSGNIANIDTGSALKISGAARGFFPNGKVRLSNVNWTRLPNAPCTAVLIRNPEGNDPIYVGGIDEYSAIVGVTCVLYETELFPFEVTNANALTLIATTNKQDVLVQILSNEDLTIPVNNPGPPDITPPTVSSYFPGPMPQTNIDVNTQIYAIFSEELLEETVNTTNITVSPAISYQVSKDAVNPNKVTITPAANLAFNTVYTITFGVGLEDLEDNNLAAPFVFSFTTKNAPPPPDVTAPTVIATTPTNNATNAATDVKPTITFSEDMLDSTITGTNIRLYKDVDNTPVTLTSLVHSTDGKTITITPGTALASGTKYRIEVTGGSSGVKDVAGNALAATYIFRFTTVAAALNTIYTLAGSSELKMYSGNYTELLEYCANAQSFLINQYAKEFTFEAMKVGSPTGNLEVVILDNNNNVVYVFEETKAASSLTTAYQSYTLKSPNNNSTTAGSKKILQNYKIGIRYTGGSSSSYVKVRYANNTNYNAANSYMRVKFFGFYSDYSDSDIAATIKGSTT